MTLFMCTLFMLSFALAMKSVSAAWIGLVLRLLHFVLLLLSIAAGWFFSVLYQGPFGNPGSLSMLWSPAIGLAPCVLGLAFGHWIEKPEVEQSKPMVGQECRNVLNG
jgi:hypothetical protein